MDKGHSKKSNINLSKEKILFICNLNSENQEQGQERMKKNFFV